MVSNFDVVNILEAAVESRIRFDYKATEAHPNALGIPPRTFKYVVQREDDANLRGGPSHFGPADCLLQIGKPSGLQKRYCSVRLNCIYF